MQAIAGVKFLQQDFLAKDAIGKIKSELLKINNNHSDGCDIVLSDMASNTTGDKTTDHFRIIDLLEEALQLSLQILKNNGCFIGKIFQGNDADKIIQQLKKNFQLVKYFKRFIS
jgi:23S rRNA (uridine2552-2'-O)-methyltransferase